MLLAVLRDWRGFFYLPGGVMSEAQVAHRLRAAIVMDYQNIHLTAHDNFEAFGTPKHHSLIHPLAYARNVIDERNRRQRSGYPHADLVKMEVYRGQPVEEHEPKRYAYTQQELSRWTRDDRIDVIYRPLKYTIDRNSGVIRGIQEKGVDVLCALAVIRAVMNSNIDLVILATHDSDLDPCLEEAVQIGGTGTRVETTGWASSQIRTRQAPNVHGRKLWRTFLDEEAYRRCLDPDR